MVKIAVVGAGFAGVECAWALAQRGQRVALFEMRPHQTTPAHTSPWFAELVCSNSLKSKNPDSPAGLLKEEMSKLGSVVLETALEHEVPAGQALGVDRDAFGKAITTKLTNHELISVHREHFGFEDFGTFDIVVLATGPLTSDELSEWLAKATGKSHLYFYDAVSPTVEAASVDFSIAFRQARYGKGEADDYVNCPFNKDEYEEFVSALVAAERVPLHAFEQGGVRTAPTIPQSGGKEGGYSGIEAIKYFSGCMPIEAIAERGADSLRFGNFKPVGLTDPRTGRRPYAVLQLRHENREGTLLSLVACQNRLRFGEQKRVFRMVPGLQNAEFVRYGVIHRNTYVDAPRVLTPDLELKSVANVFLAGQLTGVEGYVESAAIGIVAGLSVLARIEHTSFVAPPRETALGSLLHHLQDDIERDFAPMNINWGLLPEPYPQIKDKALKRAKKLETARRLFSEWIERASPIKHRKF